MNGTTIVNTPAQLPRAVYLVDDDESILKSLGCVLTLSGLHVEKYSSGDAFLARVDTELSREKSATVWPQQACCLVLDINMPRVSGTAVFQRLKAASLLQKMPVIFLTGHGDVPLAVDMFRAGAHHFLEKPADPRQLLNIIAEGHEKSAAALLRAKEDDAEEVRWNKLTPREQEVMLLVRKAYTTKEIAERLGIAYHTAQSHRERARQKLGIRHTVELFQRPSGFLE